MEVGRTHRIFVGPTKHHIGQEMLRQWHADVLEDMLRPSGFEPKSMCCQIWRPRLDAGEPELKLHWDDLCQEVRDCLAKSRVVKDSLKNMFGH